MKYFVIFFSLIFVSCSQGGAPTNNSICADFSGTYREASARVDYDLVIQQTKCERIQITWQFPNGMATKDVLSGRWEQFNHSQGINRVLVTLTLQNIKMETIYTEDRGVASSLAIWTLQNNGNLTYNWHAVDFLGDSPPDENLSFEKIN